jgi:GDP-L-fucose synthase
MEKHSTIFVAGHKGLVGSAIVRKLKEEGYTNIITRNRQQCDLTNPIQVKALFEENRIDYVFDAAAKVGGIKANDTYSAEFIFQNTMIQTNLIHYAYKYFVKKFCFLGSVCIYPKYAPTPVKEESLLCGELEPTNEGYAVAKIHGIEMLKMYNKQYGFKGVSIMPCNLYGIGDNFHPENSHVIPGMIRRFHEAKGDVVEDRPPTPTVECWGDGTPMREFMYSDDIADACLFAMDHYENAELINVGSGEDVSIKELAETIASVTGYKGEIVWDTTKPNGTPKRPLDYSKISSLGWKPKYKLKEGLEKSYEWFKEND